MLNATTTCAAPDASGTTQCTTLYAQSSTTDPVFIGGFTCGEIVIATFLFLNLAIASMILFHLVFRRTKIKT